MSTLGLKQIFEFIVFVFVGIRIVQINAFGLESMLFIYKSQ